MTDSNVSITGSFFEDQKGTNGGCIYASTSPTKLATKSRRILIDYHLSKLMIKNSTFQMNQAQKMGGVIYLQNINTEIEDCLFLKNTA